MIPWKKGRCVTWDVTVNDTLAQLFYLPATSALSGAAAKSKMAKYVQLAQSYTFIPVAVETVGPINNAGLVFLISQASPRERLPLPTFVGPNSKI